MLQRRVSGPVIELLAEEVAEQPAGAPAVGHDVGDRLSVHGQDHSLAGTYGVDHPVGLVS